MGISPVEESGLAGEIPSEGSGEARPSPEYVAAIETFENQTEEPFQLHETINLFPKGIGSKTGG